MAQRDVLLRDNTEIIPCPKCGNNTKFKAHAQQVAEDGCDIWISCICGYDPTENNTLNRLEDIWGDLDMGTVKEALYLCWNDVIKELQEPQNDNA